MAQENTQDLIGLLAKGSQAGFFNLVKKLSGAEEGELGAELSRQQRGQPQDALGFGDQLGLLNENIFGGDMFKPQDQRQPNMFFQNAAAENPAQGGESSLVRMLMKMQSTRPDRSSIEDLVLQLMLRTAIGKSSVPEGAVQPQVNIPQPQLPAGTPLPGPQSGL